MDDLHRLFYWSSETSQYMEESSDWNTFLEWRRRKLGETSTVQTGEYQCPQFQWVLELPAEVENFRQSEYQIARTWLKCWQRLVRWYEEEIETLRWWRFDSKANHRETTPSFLYVYAEAARSYVKDSGAKTRGCCSATRKGQARACLFSFQPRPIHWWGDHDRVYPYPMLVYAASFRYELSAVTVSPFIFAALNTFSFSTVFSFLTNVTVIQISAVFTIS